MDQGEREACLELVTALMRHKAAWPFNQPVDPVALGIPDYFLIVRNPMDLGTIRSRLEQDTYTEVMADIALVWYNCHMYNNPGSDIVCMVSELEQETTRLVTELGIGTQSATE